ncbi:patatin-like phospholipase family protein [Uliginosibacterium sp. H3]|uniref:Patatin-like phospholipase family protein n=1 Tax=Uliginosibacterium silvisoli TaxID=3114758 RepID=A0ABU6JXS0_9RHOO|nr:patatin-like phospholipase family protein [Uliginosibacterium sp. H3]
MKPTVVALAADAAETTRRSLVLAGGGMRVAWQAGVLKALHEAGLRFHHGDGTSGGTMNLGMLLSGLTPDEMCERWRTLDVKDFVSFMPMREYFKALNMKAMGDADGIVEKVFPHLGIDPARIRLAEGMAGSFNVCNFTQKTNEAIPHMDIDLDLLVAGISLPIFMPAVKRGDTEYLDSVWIKDANLIEAVKRGAEEVWLVWCIGNTPTYHDGSFNQYVHMIELSAAGKLNEEMALVNELNERIARGDSPYGQKQQIRLHVVKPEKPLPLDPDFYLGRIDSATLVDRGYADAMRYLRTRKPEGMPLTPEATQMQDAGTGIAFRETMAGYFSLGAIDPKTGAAQGKSANTQLALHASIDIEDIDAFVADPQHRSGLSGHVDFAPLGTNMPASHGVFALFMPGDEPGLRWMVYELGFQHAGKDYYLAGKKEVRVASPLALWPATTTLYTKLHEGRDTSGPVVGAGVLSLGVSALMSLLSTFHATNAPTMGKSLGATGSFAGFFTKSLVSTYIMRR